MSFLVNLSYISNHLSAALIHGSCEDGKSVLPRRAHMDAYLTKCPGGFESGT